MQETIPEATVVVTGVFDVLSVERWGLLIVDAVELAPARLVLDLRDCPLVDAAAIAVMLQAHRAMIHGGGRLILREPTSRVRGILRLARLEQVFEVEQAQRPETVGA